MDHQTNSTTQKIIKLTNDEGVVSWMLFTEDRKLARSGTSELYSDQVNIKLQTLGSFDSQIRTGDVVMKMRGLASSYAAVNFSDGYIVVEEPWKGMRIGTYMMNYLVTWAKDNYPDSSAVGIRLGHHQAYDENRERRNRFYARFGFKFKWDDDEAQREGHLDPELRIFDLRTTDKWQERIVEFSVKEGTKELFSEADRLQLECSDSKVRALSAISAMKYAKAEAERCRAGRTRWGLYGLALGFVLAVILKLKGL